MLPVRSPNLMHLIPGSLYSWSKHLSMPPAQPVAATVLLPVSITLTLQRLCVSDATWYLPFSVWTTSVSITPSKSIRTVTNGRMSFFLVIAQYAAVCVDHMFFICPSTVRLSGGQMLLLLWIRFRRVWLCVTPQTAAHQAPPPMGFTRQEHQNGLPFPSPMHESEKWKWSCSVMPDLETPWTAAYQALPSMGFSRQEYWSGLPLPSPIVYIEFFI